MIITENYFNDINITDEDIKEVENNDVLPSTVNELYNQLKPKYSKNIRIPIDYVYLWSVGSEVIKKLPDILRQISKRINYILNFFNIEHSDIYVIYEKLFHETPKVGTEITRQNGYIQVKHPSIILDPREFRVHIDAYVNFPNFSCKEATRFALMFEDVIWKKNYHNFISYFKVYNGVKYPFGLAESDNITFYYSNFNPKKLNLRYIDEKYIEAAKTIINCFIGIETANYLEEHYDIPNPFDIQAVPNDKTDYEYDYYK